MSTNLQFENIIKSYPENIQELARATRDFIFEILPQAVEVPWEKQKVIGYGTGPKKMSEHFCWIQLAQKHVNLGFNYGTELPDPTGILEGTGKKFRHFKIKNISDLDNPDLIKLMKYAVHYKVPAIKEPAKDTTNN